MNRSQSRKSKEKTSDIRLLSEMPIAAIRDVMNSCDDDGGLTGSPVLPSRIDRKWSMKFYKLGKTQKPPANAAHGLAGQRAPA